MADIVVFGASGGIGQHLVRSLSADHTVLGTYHSAAPDSLAEGAAYHALDITDSDAVNAFVAGVRDQLQRPVLVYTPGVSPDVSTHKIEDADWERALSTNLSGAMYVTRAMLPIMREVEWGRIVYLSSVAVHSALARLEDRCEAGELVEVLFHPSGAAPGEEWLWNKKPSFQSVYYSDWRMCERSTLKSSAFRALVKSRLIRPSDPN